MNKSLFISLLISLFTLHIPSTVASDSTGTNSAQNSSAQTNQNSQSAKVVIYRPHQGKLRNIYFRVSVDDKNLGKIKNTLN